MNSKYFIHESSYVDTEVKIGRDTKIWHFCHIMKNTKIGVNCSIGQNCVIGPNVKIGNNIKVQNNISIYDGVEIEDDVELAHVGEVRVEQLDEQVDRLEVDELVVAHVDADREQEAPGPPVD